MFGFNPSMAQRVQQRNQDQKREQQMLDGIKEAAAQITTDPISERMAIAVTGSMRLAALAIVLQTAAILDEGQDEDNEMLPNELLDSLMLEAFDEDDGDDDSGAGTDTDADANIKAVLSAHVADAFSSLGVDDSVIDDMFSTDLDVADTAIESACQTVIENLPDDGQPLDDFANAFAFGWGDDGADDTTDDSTDPESGYDGVMFDKTGKNSHQIPDNAKTKKHNHKPRKGVTVYKQVNGHKIAYRGFKAVRNGKVVTINKRIGGTIVLTSGQKSALHKARSKAHTAHAITKQMRSFTKGIKRAIYVMSAKQQQALKNAMVARHTKAAFN